MSSIANPQPDLSPKPRSPRYPALVPRYPALVYWEWFSCTRQHVQQVLKWLTESPTDNPVAEATRQAYLDILKDCAQLLALHHSEAFKALHAEERAQLDATLAASCRRRGRARRPAQRAAAD